VSASGAGSVGVGSSRADSSGAGVAAAGFGLCLTALADLMKQSQLYHYKSKRAECSLCKKMYTYSEDLFMTAFFTLMARGVPTMVLVAGGGVTSAGGAVPAMVMVTDPVAEAAGSVPISWRLVSGGEAGGLQTENIRVQQYGCMTTRQHIHTWRTRLLALFVCAQSGDPAGPKAEYRSTPRTVWGSCLFSPPPWLPFPPGGFRLQWTRCREDPRLLEPSSLRLRCWGEGGPVEGCRVAEGSCGTTLCAPTEGFQLAVAEQNLFST
jgi:hypothetical protein